MVRRRRPGVGVALVTPVCLFGDGFELVADAVARLDEGVTRRLLVDLLPQAADEDVHGTVAVGLAPSPELLQQFVARGDAALIERELVEQPELGRRQLGTTSVDIGLHLAGVDAQLFYLDRLAARCLVATNASARGSAHTRNELLHRERLDEVVV